MSDQENLRKCARMVNVPWPRCGVHICTGKKGKKKMCKMKSGRWLDRTAMRVAKIWAIIDPELVLANFA